ncbi:MAG: hypothetical protein QGI78_02975 [Phycisphaerales bacterium]|jgi:pimeloyl-ACP methyl ester carboxylesterase|nr:hypothetical protein [Phycisphaerales bacterium]
MQIKHWHIEGSKGELIHGSTHEVDGQPTCNLLIAHGFKGYKEYGCFPWIAHQAALQGVRAHRFNFSHSGMLDGSGSFERPDLFELATWNTQVEDLQAVVPFCSDPEIPTILLGHSRGGVAILLAASRGSVHVDHLIPLAAPATCNPLSEEMQQTMLRQGYIESPSSRTDQMLRIGRCFLDEQTADPAGHDLLSLVGTIDVPITVIHGDQDETVPVSSGETLAKVARDATFNPIYGGTHVFNTPNPFPIEGEASPQLQRVWAVLSSIFPEQ